MSALTLKDATNTTILDVSDSGALVASNVGTAKIAVIAGGSASTGGKLLVFWQDRNL